VRGDYKILRRFSGLILVQFNKFNSTIIGGGQADVPKL
jgi:hypothetical protein